MPNPVPSPPEYFATPLNPAARFPTLGDLQGPSTTHVVSQAVGMRIQHPSVSHTVEVERFQWRHQYDRRQVNRSHPVMVHHHWPICARSRLLCLCYSYMEMSLSSLSRQGVDIVCAATASYSRYCSMSATEKAMFEANEQMGVIASD
eukprot:6479259-Amphidinium_carterae.3